MSSSGEVSIDLKANAAGLLKSVETGARDADRLLRKFASNSSITMGDVFTRNTASAFNRFFRSLSSTADGFAKRMGGSVSKAVDRGMSAPKAARAATAYKEMHSQVTAGLRALARQEEKVLGLDTAMEKATGAAEETKTRIRSLKDEIAALADRTSGREIIPAEEYHAAVARMREAEAELAQLEELFEKQAAAAEKAGDAYLEAAEKLNAMKAQSGAMDEELPDVIDKTTDMGTRLRGMFEKAAGAFATLASKVRDGAAAIIKAIASIAGGVLKLIGGIAVLGAAIAALSVRFIYLVANGEQPISALDNLRAMSDSLRERLATLAAVVQSVVITAFLSLAERVIAVANTIISAISSMFMAIGS